MSPLSFMYTPVLAHVLWINALKGKLEFNSWIFRVVKLIKSVKCC